MCEWVYDICTSIVNEEKEEGNESIFVHTLVSPRRLQLMCTTHILRGGIFGLEIIFFVYSFCPYALCIAYSFDIDTQMRLNRYVVGSQFFVLRKMRFFEMHFCASVGYRLWIGHIRIQSSDWGGNNSRKKNRCQTDISPTLLTGLLLNATRARARHIVQFVVWVVCVVCMCSVCVQNCKQTDMSVKNGEKWDEPYAMTMRCAKMG